MTDSDSDEASEGESALDRTVERSFTCSFCGFAMAHEVSLLQAEVASVCYNCGDWTTQTADRDVIVDAAETAAAELANEVLTERQALAYLLREIVGLDRQPTAEAMDSTPSNVDNLQRRAAEKVTGARELVDDLNALTGADDSVGDDDTDSDDDTDDHRHRPV